MEDLIEERGSLEEIQRHLTNGVVLMNFSAPWCAPCKLQEPIIENLVRKFKDKAKVLSLDVNEMQDVAKEMGIHSVPTIVIFKQRKEIERFVGLQEEQVLVSALERAIGLRREK